MRLFLSLRAFYYRLKFYRAEQRAHVAAVFYKDAMAELDRSAKMDEHERKLLQNAREDACRAQFEVTRLDRIRSMGL